MMTVTLKNDYTRNMDFDIFATDHYSSTLVHLGTIPQGQSSSTSIASGYPRYTVYGTAPASVPNYQYMHDSVYTLERMDDLNHVLLFLGDDMGMTAFVDDPPPSATDDEP